MEVSLKQDFDQIRQDVQSMNTNSLKLPEYIANFTREICVRLPLTAIGSLESAITTGIKGRIFAALATLTPETIEGT